MKLSTKCRYGARAIVEIARNYKKYPTKKKNIVLNQDLTDSYLENILLTLKSNSIIDTIRGSHGGFILRRSPSTITLLEIVEALDGPIEPVECLDNPSVCNRSNMCVTRPVWMKMQSAQKDVLRSVTVQDLVDNDVKADFSNFNI